jgi:4-amino-4-deoxychorismate lyase
MLNNGEVSNCIDASDRGLHYGDGLFETIAVVNQQPLFWIEHLERLIDGCKRLAIPQPDLEQLQHQAVQLCTDLSRGVLKIIVTRGSGGRGYRPLNSPRPTVLLNVYPWPDYPEEYRQQGIAVRYCSTPLACNPKLAGIKHLNRLEQVLARSEWDDDQIAEGLMLNLKGDVIEGTQSNLFLVEQGQLITPEVDQCGVAGVMRKVILRLADDMAIDAVESTLNRERVEQADELFVCNSVIGIWPVRRIEQHEHAVGPVTRSLSAKLSQIMDA